MEAIGGNIALRSQADIQRAVQLDLPEVAGTDVPVLYIEMDGTGVPVTTAETEGRKGKNPDEGAHTREVKLGCVFTPTTTNKEGRPMRDHDSSTYAGAVETAEEFGRQMNWEARPHHQAWRFAMSQRKRSTGAPRVSTPRADLSRFSVTRARSEPVHERIRRARTTVLLRIQL